MSLQRFVQLFSCGGMRELRRLEESGLIKPVTSKERRLGHKGNRRKSRENWNLIVSMLGTRRDGTVDRTVIIAVGNEVKVDVQYEALQKLLREPASRVA